MMWVCDCDRLRFDNRDDCLRQGELCGEYGEPSLVKYCTYYDEWRRRDTCHKFEHDRTGCSWGVVCVPLEEA